MDELEARTAALRDKVDGMLESLERQVGRSAELRAEAAAVTGEATSADGQVSVTTDTHGVVTGIRFAPSAFARNTPDRLTPVLVHTIQQAAADARHKADAALQPLTAELPDLPDLFDGAPSLRHLATPPAAAPAAPATPPPPPPPPPPRAAAPRPPRPQPDSDDEPVVDILRRR